MLVERNNSSTVRLPEQFRKMDIKDLLESNSSPRYNGDRRYPPPTDRQVATPPSHHLARTISTCAPDLPPASGIAPHPVLPSPAPTVIPSDSYYRRSPPYPVKSEYSESGYPAWEHRRRPSHSTLYGSYQGYEYSSHYPPHPLSLQSPNKRAPSLDEHAAKRHKKGKGPNQKWDAEEDARIIELRGSGMKWGDISKNLPGRTEIACRLHYQNYLEKRGQWDEEKKTKLARVYERCCPSPLGWIRETQLTNIRMKADLWQPLANELGVPWRSAEAMHWLLGEREMARRANTIPFALVSGPNSAGPQGEGNGRIAQTNRMLDSTICFEPSDIAALQATSPPAQGSTGSTGAFRFGYDARAGLSGGSEGSDGPGYGDYDGDNDSPTGLGRPSGAAREDKVKREGQVPSEEGIRLPRIAQLDSGYDRNRRDEGAYSNIIHHPYSASRGGNSQHGSRAGDSQHGSNGSLPPNRSNGSNHRSSNGSRPEHALVVDTQQRRDSQGSNATPGSGSGTGSGPHSGTASSPKSGHLHSSSIPRKRKDGSHEDRTSL